MQRFGELRVNNLIFPVEISPAEYSPDLVDVYIGNLSGRPCIHITVDKSNVKTVTLQTLYYFRECSKDTRMLKGVLKWIVDEYDVQRVEFTDTSGQSLMLPEMMVLTQGQTWYQKHFGAIPGSDFTKSTLKAYLAVRKAFPDDFESLPLSSWEETNIAKTLEKYALLRDKCMTGTTWTITRATIEDYDVVHFTEVPFMRVCLAGAARSNVRPKRIIRNFWRFL